MNMQEQFIEQVRHGSYWKKDEPVIVAVSGGVDSIVLFDLLYHLPEALKPEIIVAHVNHQLRPTSDQEEQLLCEMMEKRQITLHTHRWSEKEHPISGIEKAARTERYSFFNKVAELEGSRNILTAHHRNDQVETILMRLTRGSSLEEMTGIQTKRKDGNKNIIRLLLGFSKEQLLDYACSHDLKWIEDESNESFEYTRNRFRQVIIPLLKEENTAFEQHIISFSKEIDSLLTLIEPVIEQEMASAVEFSHSKMTLHLTHFILLDKIVKKRVLIEAFKKWKDGQGFIVRQVHLDILINWLDGSSPNSSIQLPDQLIARKEYDHCFIYFQSTEESAENDYIMNQSVDIGMNRWTQLSDNEEVGLFSIEEYSKIGDPNHYSVIYLNDEDLTLPLRVRHRNNGDRIKVKGLKGTKKVKDIFIDQKVPIEKRNKAWLIEDQTGQVVWLVDYKESLLSRNPRTDTISYVLIYSKSDR